VPGGGPRGWAWSGACGARGPPAHFMTNLAERRVPPGQRDAYSGLGYSSIAKPEKGEATVLRRTSASITGAVLLTALAVSPTNGRSLAAEPARFEALSSALNTDSPSIHPDCADSKHPQKCTKIVNQIQEELALFNQAFNPPNLDEIVKFYHPEVIHYISSTGRFYRGRTQLRNEFIAPFLGVVSNAELDFSPFHFRVVSPDLVITYGAIPGVIHLNDGSTVVQPPLPQTVTWVRNDEDDPSRPFVVIADHE
jgi:hypothetical protein